jgi:hypothetical protein
VGPAARSSRAAEVGHRSAPPFSPAALGVYSSPRECLALAAPGLRVTPELDPAARAEAREAWRRKLALVRG